MGNITAKDDSNISVGTFKSELIIKVDTNGIMTSNINITGDVEPTLSVADDHNFAQIVGWVGPNNTLPTPGPNDADILEATLTIADIYVLLQPQISQIEEMYNMEILDSWTAQFNEIAAVSTGSPPNVLDQFATHKKRVFPYIFITNECIVLETTHDYVVTVVDMHNQTKTIIPPTKIYARVTHDPNERRI